MPSLIKKRVSLLSIAFSLMLSVAISTVHADGQENMRPVPNGLWGGSNISLNILETGAGVEFNCAVGRIEEAMVFNELGQFEAKGVYIFERGGPVSLYDPKPIEHPAQYHGWTDGNQMQLTVLLVETGKKLGPFSLKLGARPMLEKCL